MNNLEDFKHNLSSLKDYLNELDAKLYTNTVSQSDINCIDAMCFIYNNWKI